MLPVRVQRPTPSLLSPAPVQLALATFVVGLLGGLAVRLLSPSDPPDRAGPIAPPLQEGAPPAPEAPVTPPGDMGLPGADVVAPPGGGTPEAAPVPAPVAPPVAPPSDDWLDAHLQAAGTVWAGVAEALAVHETPALRALSTEAEALRDGVPPPDGRAPPLAAVSRYLGAELSLAARLGDAGFAKPALDQHLRGLALPR